LVNNFKSIWDNSVGIDTTGVGGRIKSDITIFTPFGGPRVLDGENGTIGGNKEDGVIDLFITISGFNDT